MPLPRYFFDIDIGSGSLRDEEGTDLHDDGAAREEATKALVGIGKDCIPGDGPQRNITIKVRNEQGAPVMQLDLSFAVKALAS